MTTIQFNYERKGYQAEVNITTERRKRGCEVLSLMTEDKVLLIGAELNQFLQNNLHALTKELEKL